MTARDAMEFMNEQDEATLQRFVERLEFRGRDPKFVAYRDAYVARMGLAPTAQVLDLGCGPGRAVAAMRQRWPRARVVALDMAVPMLREAGKRSAGCDQ